MTTNFYAPSSAIRKGRVVLPDEEARHARTVLRVAEGDEIVVVDGEGGWYRTRVENVSSQQLVGTIVEQRSDVGEPAAEVTVGLGLLKERRRFETFAEKAVELGAHRIVPLQTERTETETLRTERVRNVMIAALKQCRRSWLPTLTDPQPLDVRLSASKAEAKLFCHASAEAEPIRQAVDEEANPTSPVLALVGPEGGFSPSEVEAARQAGCTPVSLGRRRLRAETAGLAALHAVLLMRR